MKHLLLLLFFIQFSTIVGASEICDRFRSTEYKTKCMQAVEGKITNDYAVKVCEDMYHNSDKIECLQVIAGKIMNNSAIKTCEDMYHNSDKIKCLQTIYRIANDSAVKVCEDMYHNSDKIECLQAISGIPNNSTVEVCEDMYHNSDKIECLRNIGKNYYSSQHIVSNELNSNNQQDIKGVAINFCRNKSTSLRKEECLSIVAPAQFIDKNAFDLCSNITSQHMQTKCLSIIVDKTYHPALVDECSDGTEYSQTECLNKYGSSIQEKRSNIIVIQNGQTESLPLCQYQNFHGMFPAGGGCNFHGCWTRGGGCNFHGCWYSGGYCKAFECVREAPTENICR